MSKDSKDRELEELTLMALEAGINKFSSEVPGWKTMPLSALVLFARNEISDLEEWAFRMYSPKHEAEWREQTKNWFSNPVTKKMLEKSGIKSADEFRLIDELGKNMVSLMGFALGFGARLTGLENEENVVEKVITHELFLATSVDIDELARTADWGEQKYSWIALKISSLWDAAIPLVIDYELKETDAVRAKLVDVVFDLWSLISVVLVSTSIEQSKKK